MTISVKLNRTKLLEQNNTLLKRENALLRDQLIAARQALVQAGDSESETADDCDICELKKRRAFLEYRSGKELSLNTRIKDPSMQRRFESEGLAVLVCLLQELQLWKLQLAEAELASLVSQIWSCKTRSYEDCIGAVVETINRELEKCPANLSDPFVADIINDVLKDL